MQAVGAKSGAVAKGNKIEFSQVDRKSPGGPSDGERIAKKRGREYEEIAKGRCSFGYPKPALGIGLAALSVYCPM